MDSIEAHGLLSRRAFLGDAASGLGGLALLGLYGKPGLSRVSPRAERCIFIFFEGGPSQIDLYDPKPRLRQLHGQRVPESVAKEARVSLLQRESARLIGSPRTFTQHGQCGMELSDLLPHLATCVDDIALIRSLHTDAFNHHPGRLLMHSGVQSTGYPTLGSTLACGLGSTGSDVPDCAVLSTGREAGGGATSWSCARVPQEFQGISLAQETHPALYDLSNETAATREAYGVDRDEGGLRNADGGGRGEFAAFARQCLVARRLVERGTRFVNLHHASWDHHNNLDAGLAFNCAATDRPVAALLKDLKRRGLLDSTLVICAGEFGRAPLGEDLSGRDHHPAAFSIWMAGGGIKGGQIVGATDELGMGIVEDPVHVHDLRATVFHLFGLDAPKPGNDLIPAVSAGKPVRSLLA